MTDLLEVTLNYTFAGQQMVNRWNYTATGTPIDGNTAAALNEALGFHPVGGVPTVGSLLDKIKPLVHTSCTFTQCICIDPYDPYNFDASPFVPVVLGGDGGGSANAPFMSLGFRSNQTRRDIRRGTKRFGGISEALVTGGGMIDGGYASQVDALATLMGATLTGGGTGGPVTFIPCIVKKEKYVVPGSDPERFAYRYHVPHDSIGEAIQLGLIATGITWQPYTQARSQTSRQYGRGI